MRAKTDGDGGAQQTTGPSSTTPRQSAPNHAPPPPPFLSIQSGLLGAPRVGAAIGGGLGVAQGAVNQAAWNAAEVNAINNNNNNNNNNNGQPTVVYVNAPAPSSG